MYTKDELIKKGLEHYKFGQNIHSTIEELASEFKISKVTLYNNFGSKKNFQNQIVQSVLLKPSSDLDNLKVVKNPVYKKVITFMNIITDLYSSIDYKVVKNICAETKPLSIELTQFEQLYKQVLLKIIEEGQEKNLIDKNIEPLHFYYLVDMGLKYFSLNSEYEQEITINKEFSNFILDTFTRSIFKDYQSIIDYSRDKEKQTTDRIIEYYRELATLGTRKSVDTMMDELEKCKTVVETRFIDFGLSLVQSEEGFHRIHWYLFNGTQIQRNYATLYFIRNGRYDYVRQAYDLGLIDKKQAFSR